MIGHESTTQHIYTHTHKGKHNRNKKESSLNEVIAMKSHGLNDIISNIYSLFPLEFLCNLNGFKRKPTRIILKHN